MTDNTEEIIDTYAIKNKNNINYINDNIKHKITIENNKIILFRDSDNFSHKLVFELDKEYLSEYYIKSMQTSLDIKIKTIFLNSYQNKIAITYKIIDSDIIYKYLLEMSDK